MAMNLSNADAVLKEYYGPALRTTLNNEVVAFRILDETDREWSGRRAIWPVKIGRNTGIGARAEGGTLPSAGNQQYVQAQVSACYNYGRIQLSGQAMAAGKNAFISSLSGEMSGLKDDFVVDLGRQCWGDGTGRLCQVGADSNSASTVTVYNRYAEPGQPGARFIAAGMRFDAGTVASPRADVSGITVISVALSTSPGTTVDTITISATAGNYSQCETYLFNADAGGSGVEMIGIRGLVDVYTEANMWGSNAFFGATLQGISRATYPQWDCQVMGNSGTVRLIDPNLMQTAFDAVHTACGREPDFIWGHHDVVRAFLDSVSADRRYSSGNYDAGVTGLSYNGVKIERDRQAGYNSLLIGVKETLRMFTLQDGSWADDDGAVLSRVTGSDAWEGFFRMYKNLGIDGNPKSLLMIRDIRTDL